MALLLVLAIALAAPAAAPAAPTVAGESHLSDSSGPARKGVGTTSINPPSQLLPNQGEKWYTGNTLQQYGMNCTPLAGGYSEPMVATWIGYGGLANVPKVGETYYLSIATSVPGHPCGTNVSLVSPQVVLPAGTSIDTSKPIRCFGISRAGNSSELTNESWQLPTGSSGRYCPQAATAGSYQGAQRLGYRPIGNGQFFEVVVPVRSTVELKGAAGPAEHSVYAYMEATGVYQSPMVASAWVNVFPNGPAAPPAVSFGQPAEYPFWDAAAQDNPATTSDERNKGRFRVRLYSAFKAGQFCFRLYPGSGSLTEVFSQCDNVTNASDSWLWQTTFDDGQGNQNVEDGLFLQGFDPNAHYRYEWTFVPSDGSGAKTSGLRNFTSLAGPDGDGDGVPDTADSCPTREGDAANGCPPAAPPDPDKDGVFGANDKCPTDAAPGKLDGCPAGSPPKPPPGGGMTPPALTARAKAAAAVKRSALAKTGLRVAFSCSRESRASGILSIDAKTAKRMKLRKRGSRPLTIGSGSGACRGSGALVVRVKKAYAKKLKRGFRAKLAFSFTPTGGGAAVEQTLRLAVR
jgi:hypothetical protein